MVVQRTLPLPFTCIVCGKLGEAAWEEYRDCGTVLGYRMPDGISEGQRLPAPLFGAAFNPSPGWYGNLLNFSDIVDVLGRGHATEIREASLRLYMRAWKRSWERWILIAETLFSYGMYKNDSDR